MLCVSFSELLQSCPQAGWDPSQFNVGRSRQRLGRFYRRKSQQERLAGGMIGTITITEPAAARFKENIGVGNP